MSAWSNPRRRRQLGPEGGQVRVTGELTRNELPRGERLAARKPLMAQREEERQDKVGRRTAEQECRLGPVMLRRLRQDPHELPKWWHEVGQKSSGREEGEEVSGEDASKELEDEEAAASTGPAQGELPESEEDSDAEIDRAIAEEARWEARDEWTAGEESGDESENEKQRDRKSRGSGVL